MENLGTNYLFLIGIDEYLQHKKLNCCVKDCEDIRDILVEKYGFPSDKIVQLYNEKATNKKIQDELKGSIRSLTEADNLIIYFSGHGGRETMTDRGFWIPYDGHKEDYTTWLPNETILFLLRQIRAKHIVLISDSCFSNSILITESPKKSHQTTNNYDYYSSRWGLASGFYEVRDGGVGENSFFAEAIIMYLKQAKIDFRIGTLVEFVKEYFLANEIQKPQGYPLRDENTKVENIYLGFRVMTFRIQDN